MRFQPYRRSQPSPVAKSSPSRSPPDRSYDFDLSATSTDPGWNSVVSSLRAQEAAKTLEPDWNDFKASRYWLEQRYGMNDAGFGSPLFQHMAKLYGNPQLARKTRLANLSALLSHLETKLSDRELDRWVKEHPDVHYVHDANVRPMYQDPPLSPNLTWCNSSYSFIDLDAAGLIKEPNWNDAEASRAWHEQRYCPEGAHLGSPLYQYMKDCFCGIEPSHFTPSWWLSAMLSWDELRRWNSESTISGRTFVFDKTKTPLYPDPPLSDCPKDTSNTHWSQLSWADRSSSFQDLYTAGLIVEPRWCDIETSKAWLEQRYDVADPSLGTPLFQYMMDLYSSPRFRHTPPSSDYQYMLSFDEMHRFSAEFGHAMHWHQDMTPLYADKSSQSHEAIPVARHAKSDRKPKRTLKGPKRIEAKKLQDQEAIQMTLRSGIARRKYKKPGKRCSSMINTGTRLTHLRTRLSRVQRSKSGTGEAG